MSFQNYGNFLPGSDIEKARYKEKKPLISFVLILVCIFFFVGIIVNLLVIGYTAWAYHPISVNEAQFNDAQKLHSDLQRAVKAIKDTKLPHGSAVKVAAFTVVHKPGGIFLKTISITDKKITVSGTAPTVEDVHVYMNGLLLDGKAPVLENIRGVNEQMPQSIPANVKGPVEFSLAFNEDVKAPAAQPDVTVPQKKGGAIK